MRYTVSINQVKCQEWGINLAQGALFDLLNQASSWAKPHVIDSEVYFWVSRNKVIEEIPLAYTKSDTVYRALKTLHDKGLIDHIKEGKKDLIRLTELGKTWNVKGTVQGDAKLGNKSDLPNNSEINPTKLGNKSEKTPYNSEIDPTYKSTNYKSTKDKKREASPSSSKFSKPTVTELKEYFSEKECLDATEEANKFFDFYESKGWKVGKTSMKDWKAAVRNWMRREKADKAAMQDKSRFNIDNEDWSEKRSHSVPDSQDVFHASHSSATHSAKPNPKTSVMVNGLWKPPFPSMTVNETYMHIEQHQRKGEAKDEAYDRLFVELEEEVV